MKTIHLTKNAVKNHEELFPNHESKLQKTDPEFIELFDNWAFDEVRPTPPPPIQLALAKLVASRRMAASG